MSGSSVSSPKCLRTWRARLVASLVAVAGRRRWRTCAGRLAAGGDDLPGEGCAIEAVSEVVAVRLTCCRVQPERVKRPAVVGQLSLAVGSVYRADLARQTAGRMVGRAGGDREPEAQARARALDAA